MAQDGGGGSSGATHNNGVRLCWGLQCRWCSISGVFVLALTTLCCVTEGTTLPSPDNMISSVLLGPAEGVKLPFFLYTTCTLHTHIHPHRHAHLKKRQLLQHFAPSLSHFFTGNTWEKKKREKKRGTKCQNCEGITQFLQWMLRWYVSWKQCLHWLGHSSLFPHSTDKAGHVPWPASLHSHVTSSSTLSPRIGSRIVKRTGRTSWRQHTGPTDAKDKMKQLTTRVLITWWGRCHSAAVTRRRARHTSQLQSSQTVL